MMAVLPLRLVNGMRMGKKPPKSIVMLVAQDVSGTVVERTSVSVDDYYDGTTNVVDDSEYRKAKGIRRLTGKIYGTKRELMQRFVVLYNADGEYVSSRGEHEDGTVTGDLIE